MSSHSKVTVVSRLRALIVGTQKHYPSGSLTFGGATYVATDLVTLFQKLIDSIIAADAARASYLSVLQLRNAAKTQIDPIVLAFEQYLRAVNGNTPTTLGDFGLSPRKAPAPLTTEQLAAKVAKAQATRKARGTKGPKAKASIKGTVPAPAASITPAAAVATPPKLA